MKKFYAQIDMWVRVLVIVVVIVLGLRVLIYSTEVWRKIIIIGVPLLVYNTIAYVKKKKCQNLSHCPSKNNKHSHLSWLLSLSYQLSL